MRGMLIVAVLVLGCGSAAAETCASLYVQRNAVYKDAGYCFKTPRAIRTFGNAGCQYDNIGDVPLSPPALDFIASIRDQERIQGCVE